MVTETEIAGTGNVDVTPGAENGTDTGAASA